MSAGARFELPLPRPNMRFVVVSLAVISTYPLPEPSSFVDTAPALPQPVDTVFFRLLPEIQTPAGAVHTTGCVAGCAAAWSSLRRVARAWARAIVALTGLERFK